jgi:outer membrane protein assembly factor BamB
VDLEGKHLWTSGRADRFGLGPFIIADRLLFIMNDSGLLTLAEAAPDGYKPLARAQVMKGREAWGPMAIAGGRLIVRDIRQMLCLDVAAPK